MSKSIWIFNQYAITPDMPGGSRHYDFARELVKRGYDVTIFASSFNYSRHMEMRLKKSERWKMEMVDGIRFIWIRTPHYQRNNWRRILNMFSYTYRSYLHGRRIIGKMPEVPKPDVVIGSTVHLLAVLTAHYVARYYGAKFIMEVRDLWPQTLIDLGSLNPKSLTAKMMYALEAFLYRKAEKIITLLPLAGEYIAKCGVNSDKIIWIPNGVDLSLFKREFENKKKTDQNFSIFYLGAHGTANALDTLIYTARIIQERGRQNTKFVLVGDGPEKQRLIHLKEELKIANVEFRDPVKKSEVPECLAEADAFLCILLDIELYKYGISLNKMVDYLASGKPTIMAGKPVNNLVEEADCGISVPPGDPEVLADAVITLRDMSSDERYAMGRRGYEHVAEYYSINVLADKLVECFDE